MPPDSDFPDALTDHYSGRNALQFLYRTGTVCGARRRALQSGTGHNTTGASAGVDVPRLHAGRSWDAVYNAGQVTVQFTPNYTPTSLTVTSSKISLTT